MKDVAARAGVALSSVSRVLSEHPDVSPEMRDRVLAAAFSLGYETNLLAQSMRTGTTRTIGFVVRDVSNPLFAQIALGAENTLSREGYSLLLANSGTDPDLDATNIRLLRRRRADGLLLSLVDEKSAPVLRLLDDLGVPLVLIDREVTGHGAVLSDHMTGFASALEHLVALGHRRIAVVNGHPRVRPARQRAAAARSVGRRYPKVRISVVSGEFSESFGKRAASSLLSGDVRPTALVAGSNQILIGVLRELTARDLRVPEDLSLVTCDSVPLMEFLSPPLSAIVRDPVDLGATGAKLLLEQLQGGLVRSVLLPTRYEPAASCAPPPKRTPTRHRPAAFVR